jgi:hypothetical protein
VDWQMNDIISEFFFDGIKRIIPGLVVIFLFADRLIGNVFSMFPDSSIILYSFILLAAWLIVTIAEVIPVVVILLPLKWLSPHYSWASDCFSQLLPSSPQAFSQNIELINEFQKENIEGPEIRQRWWWYSHRQIYKAFAEKVMFRSLSLIFLVTSFPWFYPESFSRIHWCWYYGVLGSIFFFFAWWWMRSPLPKDNEKKHPTGSAPKTK